LSTSTAVILRFDVISHFLHHGGAEGLNYMVESPCCGEAGPIYTLKKFKILWALFPPARGLLPSIFEFPFSRSLSPYFFPTFDLNCHFLIQCIQPPDDYLTSW